MSILIKMIIKKSINQMTNVIDSFYYEIVLRTVFVFFSLSSGLSSLLLIVFLLFDLNLFLDKFLTSFMYFNYWVFGPYMLGYSSLGLYYWEKVVYIMDSNGNVSISFSNLLGICFATIISLIITLSISALNAFSFHINSITLQDHNKFLQKIVWKVLKRKLPENFSENEFKL